MPAFLPPSPLFPKHSAQLLPLQPPPLHHVFPSQYLRKTRSIFPLQASLHPDALVIGAGPAGLCTALELRSRGLSVHILTAPTHPPSGFAAAGMLAPQAESLSGPMRQLCDLSLSLYPALIHRLRNYAPDIDVAFISNRAFLIPYLQDELLPPDALRDVQMRMLEPALADSVIGVKRLEGEASVDNRALMNALRRACERLGIVVEECKVERIEIVGDSVQGVIVEGNEWRNAGEYIVANGAWMKQLLPWIPVQPVKGEMISIRPWQSLEHVHRLQHVLHAKECYVVPRGDEYYVGATMKQGTFSTYPSVDGVYRMLNAVKKLIKVDDYELKQVWAGVRPATPDGLPVIGKVANNLCVVGGGLRNGILLAPALGKCAADCVLGTENKQLVGAFEVHRFWRGEEMVALREQSEQRKASRLEPTVPEESQMKVEAQQEKVEAQRGEGKMEKVMLWRVKDDGSRQPVGPSQRAKDEGITERGVMEMVRDEEEEEEEVVEVVKGSEQRKSTDAYDDVMQHRDEWEETMRVAMAKNRAFGREKSSLEPEDVPLSISEEEVRLYDAALQQGIDDMRQAEATFDDNHPSVIATREEMAKLDGVEVDASELNGAAKSTWGTQAQGYY